MGKRRYGIACSRKVTFLFFGERSDLIGGPRARRNGIEDHGEPFFVKDLPYQLMFKGVARRNDNFLIAHKAAYINVN
jgi:hypothetical protein